MSPINNHRKGLLLTAIGGAALTVDIPLIKLASGEPWSILMLRSAATFLAALGVWAVWRVLGKGAPRLIPGRAGLAVACLYGLGSITFTFAVFHTTTANLVFILALSTTFAALFSWVFLKERPRLSTFLAMGATLAGVLIIVGGGLGGGGLAGDAMALCSAIFIASAITITRATRRDMGFAALVGVAVPLAVATAFIWPVGLSVDAPGWILLDGAVVMPLAFFCLATGPKYLSGPEVAMFYLLETVFAPIWVWILFAEKPPANTLLGGTIIVSALFAHALWQLAHGQRRKAPPAPAQPAWMRSGGVEASGDGDAAGGEKGASRATGTVSA